MLSDSYANLGALENSPPSEASPKAQAAAAKALSIDDTLAEGHMRLAQAKFIYEWDWEGARREYRRAIELDADSATAHQRYSLFLTARGHTEESLAEIRRALELDPVSLIINSSLGRRLYSARRYDEAVDQFKKTLEMDLNFTPAHFYMGKAYVMTAQYKEALAAFKQAQAYSKVAAIAMEGYAFAASGKGDKAREILNELKEESRVRYVSLYDIAIIYTGLREKDQALTWLQKACDDRSFRIVFLGAEPLFDDLRSDRRFQKLLERVGLWKQAH